MPTSLGLSRIEEAFPNVAARPILNFTEMLGHTERLAFVERNENRPYNSGLLHIFPLNVMAVRLVEIISHVQRSWSCIPASK